jgi:hypothetical protein
MAEKVALSDTVQPQNKSKMAFVKLWKPTTGMTCSTSYSTFFANPAAMLSFATRPTLSGLAVRSESTLPTTIGTTAAPIFASRLLYREWRLAFP